MPREKVEIVRRFFDAWNDADFEPYTLENVDPAVEIDWSESDAPYGGIYSGHDGWHQLFAEIRQAFQNARAEAHEHIVVGQHVVVPTTAHMRGRDGIEVIARTMLIFTFRDDKVVAVRLWQNDGDAVAALRAGEL